MKYALVLYLDEGEALYYEGYNVYGPRLTPILADAWRFDSRQNAENVINGDERLKEAKIEEVN